MSYDDIAKCVDLTPFRHLAGSADLPAIAARLTGYCAYSTPEDFRESLIDLWRCLETNSNKYQTVSRVDPDDSTKLLVTVQVDLDNWSGTFTSGHELFRLLTDLNLTDLLGVR